MQAWHHSVEDSKSLSVPVQMQGDCSLTCSSLATVVVLVSLSKPCPPTPCRATARAVCKHHTVAAYIESMSNICTAAAASAVTPVS